MNNISNYEILKLKAVYECLNRLISYGAKNSEDFLWFFLKEILEHTGSKNGYIFILKGQNHSYTLIKEINCDESEGNRHKSVYDLSQSGDWSKLLAENKIFVQNNNTIFEKANRFCSIPLTISDSFKVVMVIADKDQDYGIDDINYLESLTIPAIKLASNFRRLEELTLAKERAEKNDQRKLSYLINISHEIKTPVNAISGFSQLLKENDISSLNREKFLDVILESSTDLVEIINNVAEISNVESGLIKITEKEILLSGVFNELKEQFKEEASKKKLLLNSEIGLSEEDGRILGDKGRLIQVFSALLSNSLKFTFTGKIVFGCKRRNDFIEFFVSDTGIGIPKEERNKVFDHFFQAANTVSSSFKGTGLGLTITKAVTEKMGGEIWCDSIEGKGTEFHFTVPYKRPGLSSESKAESVQVTGIHLKKKKVVLVAEDDELNFTLISNFLSGLDLNLLRAVNGKEAVEICSSRKIDLVLMDIKMPVMDGLTATRIIRETDSEVIIIAQTAYINDRDFAIECGCTDFIAKPFGKIPLLNLINSYI
jgi:signal transduction histidine kinase/CheY-like chemotaxis protein